MAVETTYTVRASAKGFTEAGRAVEDLGRKVKKAREDQNIPGGIVPPKRGGGQPKVPPGYFVMESQPGGGTKITPGLGPAVVPGRSSGGNPQTPGPPGMGPAVLPGKAPAAITPPPGGASAAPGAPGPWPGSADKGVGPATPDPTSTAGGGGGGPGGGGGRTGVKRPLAAVNKLNAAYRAVAHAAELASKQIEQVNAHVAAGMGDFRELAGLFRGRGTGGGGGGSGGGAGGSAPPSGPRGRRGSRPQAAMSPFRQGLMEGFLPGIGSMINGGKAGMMQFAGRLGGAGARDLVNFGKAALQAPFRGIGGVQSAISSIPFFGGVMGDASAQAFQNAGTAIGFEGQQQSALPYLGRTGVRSTNLGNRGVPGLFNFDQVAALGMRKAGMGAQQSQQYLTSLAQASGGTADNPLVAGALSSSMSAFTRYGVGADVACQFVQGQRQQGASNSVGINGLIRSLAAGRGMGLEGTELQDYMRQMADDIASFKTTGIPLATESIGALGMSFNAAGITGARAASMAGNFQRSSQNIGMDGPQSVMDYMLMQAVAGRPLNGIDDSLDVMGQMQQGLSPGRTQKTFRNLLGGLRGQYGNDRKGQFAQRQALRGVGLNFNEKEYAALARSKDPTLPDDQVAAFNAGMNREALGNVSSVTQAQAGLDNSSLSLGMQGLETYFKSEQFHKDLSAGIVQGLMPYVNKMDKLMVGLYDHVIGRKASGQSFAPGQAVARRPR